MGKQAPSHSLWTSMPDLDQGQDALWISFFLSLVHALPFLLPIILIIQNTHPIHRADGNIDLPFSCSFRSLERARDMTEPRWLIQSSYVQRSAWYCLKWKHERRVKHPGHATKRRFNRDGDVNTFVWFSLHDAGLACFSGKDIS